MSPLYPRKRTFKTRSPDSDLWVSALPPKADVNGYDAGCPLLTLCRHLAAIHIWLYLCADHLLVYWNDCLLENLAMLIAQMTDLHVGRVLSLSGVALSIHLNAHAEQLHI